MFKTPSNSQDKHTAPEIKLKKTSNISKNSPKLEKNSSNNNAKDSITKFSMTLDSNSSSNPKKFKENIFKSLKSKFKKMNLISN